MLVEEGRASLEVRDAYAMDALDESMRMRRDEIADFLRASGAIEGGHAPI